MYILYMDTVSNRDLTWGRWPSDSLIKHVDQLHVWRKALVIHGLIVKSVIHSFFSIIVYTPQGKQGNYLPQKQYTTFHLERWSFYSCSVCDAFVDSRKPASVVKEVNSGPGTSGSTEMSIACTAFQMAPNCNMCVSMSKSIYSNIKHSEWRKRPCFNPPLPLSPCITDGDSRWFCCYLHDDEVDLE